MKKAPEKLSPGDRIRVYYAENDEQSVPAVVERVDRDAQGNPWIVMARVDQQGHALHARLLTVHVSRFDSIT